MSTIYRLFDLDYNVFVILDNVMELPGSDPSEEITKATLCALLKRMNLRAISVEEALKALGNA